MIRMPIRIIQVSKLVAIMACTSSVPVWMYTPSMPTFRMMPPIRWTMAYRMPAAREASVPPHHTTMVEKIAISSQNRNRVIRSPAKLTPMAPPA